MIYFFILISYKQNNDSIIINLKNRIAPTATNHSLFLLSIYLVLLYKLKIICIVCQLPQEVSDYKEDSLPYFYRYILLFFRFELLFRKKNKLKYKIINGPHEQKINDMLLLENGTLLSTIYDYTLKLNKIIFNDKK